MPVIRAAVRGMRFPEAAAALEEQWPEYTLWIINSEHDYEYGHWLREEWRGESDLVVVEQDVVPPPGSIQALLDCPADWCAHEVDLGGHLSARTLSLVKFSRACQRGEPDLAARALPYPSEGRMPVPWYSVDSALIRELDYARFNLHLHRPPAEHLHRYPGSRPDGPAPATPDRPA